MVCAAARTLAARVWQRDTSAAVDNETSARCCADGHGFGGNGMSTDAPVEDFGRRTAYRAETGNLLLRRWAGCWIDFIALGAILVGVAVILPKEMAITALLAAIALAFAYFIVLEGVWGRSLGKLATGTIVVNAAGDPPGVLRALIRTLTRLVEVNPFLLGGLPAGLTVWLTRGNQRLGDLAAGTFVVPVSGLRDMRKRTPAASVFD